MKNTLLTGIAIIILSLVAGVLYAMSSKTFKDAEDRAYKRGLEEGYQAGQTYVTNFINKEMKECGGNLYIGAATYDNFSFACVKYQQKEDGLVEVEANIINQEI